jgi:hypothetical protein
MTTSPISKHTYHAAHASLMHAVLHEMRLPPAERSHARNHNAASLVLKRRTFGAPRISHLMSFHPFLIKLHFSLQRKGESYSFFLWSGHSIETRYIRDDKSSSLGVINYCKDTLRCANSSRSENSQPLGPKHQSQRQPSLLRTGSSHLTAHPPS